MSADYNSRAPLLFMIVSSWALFAQSLLTIMKPAAAGA